MAYKNLQFCWHGIVSTDTAKARTFYTEVVGWKAEDVQMGDDKVTMFSANGLGRAHLTAPHVEGMPSVWENYLRVEDVDAAAAAAAENGGQVVHPPTDIPPGRFATVKSPSGAVLWLFRESDESDKNAPKDDLGGIHWVECHSTDAAADLAWLENSFGVKGKPMENMENGPPGGYTILHDADDMALGGIMTSMHPDAPSFWLTWVVVDDADACLERVARHGGQALNEPMDMEGIGRMAVVKDSTGAVFGIIKPAQHEK